jgi:hypothetical protein
LRATNYYREIKIEAHKNERRKLRLASLVRAVHADLASRSKGCARGSRVEE